MNKEEFYKAYKEIESKIIDLSQRQDALQLKIEVLEVEIVEEKKREGK